jgi:hypothetical protein
MKNSVIPYTLFPLYQISLHPHFFSNTENIGKDS